MRVVVTNLKGGVGKTTTTVYLAAVAASRGHTPVVVVDADRQASAAEWLVERPLTGVEVVEAPSERTLARAMSGAASERVGDELEIDPRATALVVVDLQKGIVGRPAEPRSPAEVVRNAARLADAWRERQGFAVLVRVAFAPDLADAVRFDADDPRFVRREPDALASSIIFPLLSAGTLTEIVPETAGCSAAVIARER